MSQKRDLKSKGNASYSLPCRLWPKSPDLILDNKTALKTQTQGMEGDRLQNINSKQESAYRMVMVILLPLDGTT